MVFGYFFALLIYCSNGASNCIVNLLLLLGLKYIKSCRHNPTKNSSFRWQWCENISLILIPTAGDSSLVTVNGTGCVLQRQPNNSTLIECMVPAPVHLDSHILDRTCILIRSFSVRTVPVFKRFRQNCQLLNYNFVFNLFIYLFSRENFVVQTVF